MLAIDWLAVIIGFFLGLAAGWYLARKAAAYYGAVGVEDKPGEAPAAQQSGPQAGPSIEQLKALEDEIETAKKELQALGEDTQAANEAFNALEESIKRANGRLKLAMKAVRKSE